MKYNIIYLWRGERHSKQFDTLHEARAALAEFRADKWQCWIEEVR